MQARLQPAAEAAIRGHGDTRPAGGPLRVRHFFRVIHCSRHITLLGIAADFFPSMPLGPRLFPTTTELLTAYVL